MASRPSIIFAEYNRHLFGVAAKIVATNESRHRRRCPGGMAGGIVTKARRKQPPVPEPRQAGEAALYQWGMMSAWREAARAPIFARPPNAAKSAWYKCTAEARIGGPSSYLPGAKMNDR